MHAHTARSARKHESGWFYYNVTCCRVVTGVLRYNFQYNLINTEKVQSEGLVIERIYGIAKKSISAKLST